MIDLSDRAYDEACDEIAIGGDVFGDVDPIPMRGVSRRVLENLSLEARDAARERAVHGVPGARDVLGDGRPDAGAVQVVLPGVVRRGPARVTEG